MCRDIPEAACRHQPHNYFAHVAALVATKGGDLLMNVRRVLSWVLASLGAPSSMISLLVPIRESLSLLLASSLGLLSALVGEGGIILVLALLSLMGAAVARGLPEVQRAEFTRRGCSWDSWSEENGATAGTTPGPVAVNSCARTRVFATG